MMREPGMGETRDSIVADLETLRLHVMAGALWRVNLNERRATIWMRTVSRLVHDARPLLSG